MCSKQPFLYSCQREWHWLLSSRWDRSMIFWLPLASVFFIWWLFAAQLPFQLPVGVWDEDHSSLSRQISRYLDATPGLKVARQYADAHEAEAALQAGEVYAVIYLPRNLNSDVKSGRGGHMVLNVNAQFGTHSGLIQRDVTTVVGTVSAGIQMQMRVTRGQPVQQAQASFSPLQAQNTALFNVAGDYQIFLGSVVIPALLHIFAMTAGVYSVGRELRDKTLGQWLNSTLSWRVRALALMGKLMPSILSLSLVSAVSVWLIAQQGSNNLAALCSVLFSLCLLVVLSIVLGALMAFLTLSLRMALSGAGFITSPAFAYSGIGFPLLAMSSGAYTWAMLLPYTHHARLQVQLLQMHASVHFAWPTLLGFSGAILLLFLLTIPLLQRALQSPEKWGAR